MSWKERTRLLLGEEKLGRIEGAHILVVGLGGVGAYAAEMLVRAGVGEMTIADADTVGESNINRQLIALHSTIGRNKTEVLAERLRDINPQVILHIHTEYIRDEKTYELLDEAKYDYVVTTEKDYMRMQSTRLIDALANKLQVLPIKTDLGDDHEAFDLQILSYLTECQRQGHM